MYYNEGILFYFILKIYNRLYSLDDALIERNIFKAIVLCRDDADATN